MEKKNLKVISQLQKKTSRHVDRIKLQDFVFQKLLKFPLYFVGSRGDGSNDSKSDTDLTYIVDGVIASELSHTDDTKETHEYGLQVVWADCHPGYCRLLFKRYDSAGPLYNMCAVSNGYVSSEKIKSWASILLVDSFRPYRGELLNVTDTHGPCNAPKIVFSKQQIVDLDFVVAIQCDDWPSVANEWLERDRQYDWPSQDLIHQVRNTKCIFVPVGYSEDMTNKQLEWRVSFNLAEKILMWSLNGTQILCLEALKTLHSTLIAMRFPDVICSYFLKTILFWVLEQTSSDLWFPENFTSCLKMCLHHLVSSLKSGKCAHYFIRCNNMFDRKSKQDLLQVANYIEELQIDCIARDFIDDKLNFFKQNVIFQHHILVDSLSVARHAIHANLTYMEDSMKVPSLDAFIHSLLYDCEIDKNTVHQLVKTLRSTTGALQIALRNPNDGETVPKCAMELLKQNSLSDVFAGRLKLATALHSQGERSEVLEILHDLKSTDLRKVVHYSFYERHFYVEPTDTSYPCQDTPLAEVMSAYVALDVIFMPDEILCVPDFIRYLLSDGVPVFISPIVYMNCLEFTCHMIKPDFVEMAKIIAEFLKSRDILKGGIPRIESDLLGYYGMVMGYFEESFAYLRQSLMTQYSSKASLYLMATLLTKCFQELELKPVERRSSHEPN